MSLRTKKTCTTANTISVDFVDIASFSVIKFKYATRL